MPEQPEIVVSVGPDVLRGTAKCDPLSALEELVWNSLDADASLVEINSVRNELGAVSSLTIQDDGSGFETAASDAFGAFGQSIKKLRDRTRSNRIQHGREGKGRYKALALGEIVQWRSVALDLDGKRRISTVRVSSGSPERFRPEEDVVENDQATGVVVSVMDATDAATELFDSAVATELAVRLAPYLFAYPQVVVKIDGEVVDAERFVVEKRSRTITIEFDGKTLTADVMVFLWSRNDKNGEPLKRMYFCTAEGFAVEDVPGYVYRQGISFTAYIKSSYFNFEITPGYSGIEDLDVVAREFRDKAREFVTQINRDKLHQTAHQAVADLKSESLYPFEGDAKSVVEEVERQVFDIVAEQLHVLDPSVMQRPLKERKKRMKALQLAISSDEGIVQFLLREVLELGDGPRKELYDLLQRVPLAKVIGLARTILNRLDFVAGLEHILFEKDVKKVLRERTQLQRILADHLWLFGEQFHLGTDDNSLRNVLKRHRSIIGMEEASFDPEMDYGHLDDVPDLMLYKQIPIKDGFFEHLVVELKAPRLRLGETEFSQIKRYARAVSGDVQFDKDKTTWHFVLVNNAVDQDLYEQEACQENRPRGLLIDQSNCRVWVKRWSEVVQDAKGRHEFLKRQLDIQIKSDQQGIDYLVKNFASRLPASVIGKTHSQSGNED